MKSALRILFFLALLAGGLLQLKIALFEQSRYSRPRPHARLWRQQINPAYLTAAAENLALARGLDDKTRGLLIRALTLDPLYIPAWTTLGGLLLARGEKQKAAAILAYIDRRMVDVARWRWRKTMLAYQLGEHRFLAPDLAYAVAEVPSHRRQALDLAADLWPDPETRLKKLGPENLLYLFRYALLPERLNDARFYWPLVRDNPELDQRAKLRYIELLRQLGELDQALAAWRRLTAAGTIVYNGSFATPPLQTAFGWRLGKTKGCSWDLVPATAGRPSAFHLHFDGSKNLNYHHLIQYFVLPPEAANTPLTCTLSGEFGARGLTTEQLPYLEIASPGTPRFRVKTPLFAADQALAPFSFSFTVPAGCRQAYLRLRRDKSRDINRLIAGDLWLTNLEITPGTPTHD